MPVKSIIAVKRIDGVFSNGRTHINDIENFWGNCYNEGGENGRSCEW